MRNTSTLHAILAFHLGLVALASLWLFLANVDGLCPSTDTRGAVAGGILSRADFWRSLRLSVLSAGATAFVAALVGIPAAWALSRRVLPWPRAADAVLGAILVLPASSVGLALMLLFQYGPLDSLQAVLGFRVVYSLPGLVVAQLVLSLAFGLEAWRSAFDEVDPRLELTARTLGASSFQAFHRVALPTARSGIVAGLVLAWIRAMAEFGAVLLFCGTFRDLPPSRFGALARDLGVDRADLLSVSMWIDMEYGRIEAGLSQAFALALVCALGTWAVHALGRRARGQ